MKTITIRIRLEDWKQIRRLFPSYSGETASSYFFRLTKFIEEMKNDRRNRKTN